MLRRLALLLLLLAPLPAAGQAAIPARVGTGAPPDTASMDMARRFLDAHNRERVSLGLTPLAWSWQLADSAARWARKLADCGSMHHSDLDHGENLWAGTRDAYTPEEMVELWLGERAHYKPGVFPHNSTTPDWTEVAHYTQIIWRTTKEVGCAVAKGEEEEFLVCHYAEAGNVMGERPM